MVVVLHPGDVQLGTDVVVEGGEALDDGFDPPDVENRGRALLLPAAQPVVEPDQVAKALGIRNQVF